MKFKALCFIIVALAAAVPASASNKLVDMLSGGSLQGAVRYYNYYYDGKGNSSQSFFPTNEDGGDSVGAIYLTYKSASLYGLSFGTTLAAAKDLWSDDDINGYGMLQDGHESFNKFMEYYLQGDWLKTTVKYGAQEFYTPLLNQDYCRILPNTYRGLTLVNKSIENLEVHGYYITDFMGWTDDEYHDIGAQAGPHGLNATETDNPMLVLGGRYNLPLDGMNVNLEAWAYHMPEVYDTQFVRANFATKVSDYAVYFMPSVMLQKTQDGAIENPFTAGSDNLETYEIGFEAGVTTPVGVFAKAYYARTGDDYQLTPFGFGKIVMQQYQVSGRRGNEDAYGLQVGYDFSHIGIAGLTSYVWYTLYDASASSMSDLGEYEGDIEEIDFDIRYSFDRVWPGPFGDAFVELGYAYVDRKLAGDINEVRFRVSIPFAFAGK